MPEKNFEQQARDMANGFEKEPAPGVWQNVRTAIQEPRRKRKFVLWWWLLPLAILGGGVAFYTLHQNRNRGELQTATTTKTQTKVGGDITPANQQSTRQLTAAQETKADKSIIASAQKNTIKKEKHLMQSNASVNSIDKEERRAVIQNKAAITSIILTKPQVDEDGKLRRENAAALPADNHKINTANDSSLTLQNDPALQPADSLNIALPTTDAALINTAPAADTAVIITPKKQQNKPALHWGIVAEGGIATKRASVLSIGGFEKSNDGRFATPNTSGTGSNANGQTGGSSGFFYSNSIKPGAAFGIGVAIQKSVHRNVNFTAEIAYHFQSFTITTTAYRDSFTLNFFSAPAAGSYEATQSFHFASVFAGINWTFIHAKKLQFGVSGGADNMFLLTAKQQQSGIIGSNFSLNNVQQLSDSSFAVNYFYKYQPSLLAGILVNIKQGNQSLQFVPFTRISIRSFDKNATNSNNHLFSTGLKAVYFFK